MSSIRVADCRKAVCGSRFIAILRPPFVAGKLLASTKIYNPKKIAANITILHEYDLKSKGVGNPTFTAGQLMKEMIFKLMH